MFKQLKYKLVFEEAGVKKIVPVLSLNFNEMGVVSAVVAGMDESAVIPVDWDKVTLQEFTTKFDKNGAAIFTGDIIKTAKRKISRWEKDESVGDEEITFLIGFVDGSFVAISEQDEVFLTLNEQLALIVEKVGTVFENHEMVQKKVAPETAFQQNEQKSE